MDQRRPPEYHLEISTDRSSVKDVVKGILHTIFFHRYFTPLYPATHDVLDITLPYVSEDDIETLVDARATALVRQLDIAAATGPAGSPRPSRSSNSVGGGSGGVAGRGTLVVQFLEKKRRKGWFVAKADEETVWECWVVDVTMFASPSSSSSSSPSALSGRTGGFAVEMEEARNRRVMERSVQRAALQIVATVNLERAHIPPITTNEANPFPYQILVNPKADSWGQKMGIF